VDAAMARFEHSRRFSALRRRLLAAGGALLACRTLPAQAEATLPSIPELDAYLAGRTPQFGRLSLVLPPLADDGNAVAMRISMAGALARGGPPSRAPLSS